MDKLVKDKTIIYWCWEDCLKHIIKTDIQVENAPFVKPEMLLKKCFH